MQTSRFMLAALAAILLLTNAARAEFDTTIRVSLVLICDIYDMAQSRNGRGGMARVAAAIAAERKLGKYVIVAHAGDTISPSLMSGLDQGAHMIDLINAIEPDVFVPGNHEFDFGPETFKKRMAEAKFPVLAANLADEAGNALPGIQSHRLIKAGPITLGVIGLTAEDSPERSSPGNLTFKGSVASGRRLAGELRKQGADLIVYVAHANRRIDNALIADRTADIILSGDDHDLLLKYDGKRAFMEAMEEGWYVGVVDLEINLRVKGERRRIKWWPRFRLIDTADVEPDPTVARIVAKYDKLLSDELNVPVGTTATGMDSGNATVRGGEAAIGNLFADAIRAATSADAAILNGGGFRAGKSYPAGGQITRKDILTELPFSNKTFLVEITGADLRAALEQGLSKAEDLTGAFPQVSGLTIRADLSRPVGNRIVSLKLGDEDLTDTRKVRLATNDFLYRGGDGYTALARAKVIIGETDGKLIANHVMAYIKKAGTVSPAIEGRIIVSRTSTVE